MSVHTVFTDKVLRIVACYLPLVRTNQEVNSDILISTKNLVIGGVQDKIDNKWLDWTAADTYDTY